MVVIVCKGGCFFDGWGEERGCFVDGCGSCSFFCGKRFLFIGN